MYFYEVLRANPFAALAISFSLATVWLCMRIVRHRLGADRCLVGILGFLSISQGLRILASQNGAFASAIQRYQGMADASVAGLFLLAALMLRITIKEHVSTKMQLRLVEGEKSKGPLTIHVMALNELGTTAPAVTASSVLEEG